MAQVYDDEDDAATWSRYFWIHRKYGVDIFGVHKAMIFEIMQHQFVNIVELERNWSMVYLLCIRLMMTLCFSITEVLTGRRNLVYL